MHHDIIRRTLLHHAGDLADAGAIAEATVGIWCRVVEALAPVIGRRGVDALLSRSLHITSRTFPWLLVTDSEINGSTLVDLVKVRLADKDALIAAEASHVLLTNFTVLLATLIGKALTERLLQPVWLPPPADEEQEHRA